MDFALHRSTDSRGLLRRIFVLIGVAVAIVAALPMAAHAQTSDNSLAGSSPSDGATLGTSPAIMTFTFQQPVGSDEAFTVAVGCGTPAQPQSTGIPLLGDDDVTFTVEVLSPFPRGACTITWLLRDDLDQAIATGLIAFSVSADTPTASSESTGSTIPTAASGATGSSIGDDVEAVGSTGGSVWLGGVISTYGIMILFGAVALISFGWPEGPLYEITQRFTLKVWVLALAGTYLHTAALTSSLTGTSFTASLNPFSFADTFTEGWTG
ncbi:MAG: copper resistance protein CopC, partial [Actinomycetota bacterium]|nr:copper resistance protein CopC [Actinomycetota bacterium]